MTALTNRMGNGQLWTIYIAIIRTDITAAKSSSRLPTADIIGAGAAYAGLGSTHAVVVWGKNGRLIKTINKFFHPPPSKEISIKEYFLVQIYHEVLIVTPDNTISTGYPEGRLNIIFLSSLCQEKIWRCLSMELNFEGTSV
ncbi:hypothetical protein SFRURICE_011264 [Spodoptera frugiperda]|nr:hypothetical protein SFRURICE_011264 [Spodoptera frugiperda]